MVPQSEYLEESLVILAVRNQIGNVGVAALQGQNSMLNLQSGVRWL